MIGAGPIALAVAKALLQPGIPYEPLEADDDLGGHCYHGVYETGHRVSSKRPTEDADFPMPAHDPDFPSAPQRLDSLRADAFHLRPPSQFRTKGVRCVPLADGRWEVALARGAPRLYKGVIVCNGHHGERRYPDAPGTVTGESIHSKDTTRPRPLAANRVRVIGGGNSACELASEAARGGRRCTSSVRRGSWFFPKTIFGMPRPELVPRWTPVGAPRLVRKILLRVVFGTSAGYGLPTPNHRIFAAHPTLNSERLPDVKHGRIRPRPEVERFEGHRVGFVDGTADAFDLVVCATGVHLSFPFLPPGLGPVHGSHALLDGGGVLPASTHLDVVGTAQPRYGFGPLRTPAADLMCRLSQLQEPMELPIGPVLKASGVRPPRTHLLDPHRAMRQMRRATDRLPLLRWKERQRRQRLKPTPAVLRQAWGAPPDPDLQVF